VSPRELRIHGVGGPGAVKILGEVDAHAVGTRQPTRVCDEALPRDPTTRFAFRYGHEATDAYEWGGLTAGTLLKGLWVVYLPLTVINAAGWAGRRNLQEHRWRRWWFGVLAALATATYVLWIGYIVLDLVGAQWSNRVADGLGDGWQRCTLEVGALPLAVLVFVALLVALWLVPKLSARGFEQVRVDCPPPSDPSDGSDACVEQVGARDFFSSSHEHDRHLGRHGVVLAVAGLFAIVLAFDGLSHSGLADPAGARTGIGFAIVAVAALQVVLLGAWWCSSIRVGSRKRVAMVSVGTALCHAAFAGGALLAGDALSRMPATENAPPIVYGAELAFTDLFLLVCALAVLCLAGIAAGAWFQRGSSPLSFATRMVGRVGGFVSLVGLTVVVLPVWFVWATLRDHGWPAGTAWYEVPARWFETYEVTTNTLQAAGGRFLSFLPLLVFTVLVRSSDSLPGRLVGNVWDVLTFWPRCYHGLSVPSYAARAVPEVRWWIREHAGRGPLLVTGHSQGSVIAFAAVSAELPVVPASAPAPGAPAGGVDGDPAAASVPSPVSLLTMGSPIGTLYRTFFPEHFSVGAAKQLHAKITAGGGRWVNLHRPTDPISGPIGELNGDGAIDVSLEDPANQPPPHDAPPPLEFPPLERPAAPNVKLGHSRYLADPTARQHREELLAGSSAK
jgi:hypothetical protein